MSYVYFATAGDDRTTFCKIGFSSGHPSERVKSLRTGCPYEMELAAFFEGDVSFERLLHETFSAIRMNGEWFQYLGRLECFVDNLRSHGTKRPVPAHSVEDAINGIILEPVPPFGIDYDWRLWDLSADTCALQEYMGAQA